MSFFACGISYPTVQSNIAENITAAAKLKVTPAKNTKTRFQGAWLLKESGLLKNQLDGVKVLGNGTLEKKLTIQANKFSKEAMEKINKAGSKIEVI